MLVTVAAGALAVVVAGALVTSVGAVVLVVTGAPVDDGATPDGTVVTAAIGSVVGIDGTVEIDDVTAVASPDGSPPQAPTSRPTTTEKAGNPNRDTERVFMKVNRNRKALPLRPESTRVQVDEVMSPATPGGVRRATPTARRPTTDRHG